MTTQTIKTRYPVEFTSLERIDGGLVTCTWRVESAFAERRCVKVEPLCALEVAK